MEEWRKWLPLPNPSELISITRFYKWPHRSKKPQSRAFLLPAFPMIRWTIYSIDCALSDSLSGDQARLCSLSLNPFPFKKSFFPLCLREAEPISLNSPVLFADSKGLPGPRCRVADEPLVRWGRRQLTKQAAWPRELGAGRGEAVNQHKRSTGRGCNIWWSPVSAKVNQGWFAWGWNA